MVFTASSTCHGMTTASFVARSFGCRRVAASICSARWQSCSQPLILEGYAVHVVPALGMEPGELERLAAHLEGLENEQAT